MDLNQRINHSYNVPSDDCMRGSLVINLVYKQHISTHDGPLL